MMVRIQIDGKYYEVKPGKNLLETCLALGIYVPHFCYHAALGSVGACRLCAVTKYKTTEDKTGKIVMSCMEPIKDGMVVSIKDPEAKAFRTAIIESLMTNHPHDCPVCDEGGECHLQDMTVMTGHNYRRFDFKKRTYKNQELGPFINHEMNRCIQCYRCVRFYNDYAGGKDLGVFGSRNNIYFGRYEDGNLENEFSGNLVEVCPTGVFTDKTLKGHYTRKWDLTNGPSVCVHCSVGCNIIAGERYGVLRRIMSRYNGSVNGYFLCDRGRFGYEFVNDDQRIRRAQVRNTKDKNLEETTPEKLTTKLTEAFSGAKRWIGIGSPRASLEANFALSFLAGKENFFHGVSRKDNELVKTAISILKNGTARSPSLKEIEKADAVLILGEDITQTAPMTALAVRQAARNKEMEAIKNSGIAGWDDYARREKAQGVKCPIFIASSFTTQLDDLAERTYRASPVDIARLGFGIASILNKNAPSVNNPDGIQKELAQRIAGVFHDAKTPLIITGVHSGSRDLIYAAANIAEALNLNGKKVLLSFLMPECNSMGLGMMDGKSIEDASESIAGSEYTGMIILENDLYRRADEEFLDSLFEKCNPVIVLDHLVNKTTRKADILLPVGTFAESEGTLVSNEGRAQRYYRVFPPDGSVMESWRQIKDLAKYSIHSEMVSWEKFDDVVITMTDRLNVFSKIKGHMPETDFRILNEKIKRQTIRFSGRTAIKANINVNETGVPVDPGSPLVFSMEGSDEIPPSSLISYYWVPGWNSYQAINFYLDEPDGSMKGGDPGIRLIEVSEAGHLSFFDPVDLPFKPKNSEWMVFPVNRIFGSEELSSKSPAIAERIEEPFVLMNRSDSEEIGGKDDDLIKLILATQTIEVKLKIKDSIPAGIAGLTVGLPGMSFIDLPAWGKFTIKKVK